METSTVDVDGDAPVPKPAPPMPVEAAPAVDRRDNASLPWDDFDPELYVTDNYEHLHEDDRSILQHVRDYFSSISDTLPSTTRGVDLGTGANLYPTMSMLPFCETVTQLEKARPNCSWLRQQSEKYDPLWNPYWQILESRARYRDLDPRELFQEKVTVRQFDIFKTPARARWDMGTMFFVAESITSEFREFKRALTGFIKLLKPGAPFAAAFMQDSEGYTVGDVSFPAVAIRASDVEHILTPHIEHLTVSSVRSPKPIRKGTSMILALGRAGARTTLT